MTQTLALFIASFVVTALLGLSLLRLLDRSRRLRRVRLVRYHATHSVKVAETVSRRLQANQTRRQGRQQRHRWGRLGQVLETRIREAGLSLTPEQAVGIILALGGLLFAALVVWGVLPFGLAFVLAMPAGYLCFSIWLGLRKSQRLRAFTEALPDCVDIFARGLKSGQPVPVSLQVVADRSRGIAKEEFQLCCDEMRMGVSLVDALTGIAIRVGSPEARFIATATSLQAETGGNLIETLENLSELLRERRKLRKKASALSAEVRVSALILSSLPFVIGLVLWVMNRAYLLPFFIDPRGQIMGLAALFSLSLGAYSMFRLSRLDV